MALLNIKGHEFNVQPVRDSFQRRVVQFRNKIIETLSRIGLEDHQVDIADDISAIKRESASASWYYEGHHLHYSYSAAGKYVDNMYVVMRVIQLEVEALLSEKKTPEEFISDFTEDKDVAKQRKEARALIGVSEDCLDMALIDKKFKELARENHPDMPNGDHEKFKEINRAHKILKRDLT